MDEKLMESAPNLAFIARSGAGLENIDLEAAQAKNISIISSPEGNMDAVGEHAIGMLLMLFNRLAIADAEVKKGVWLREENRGIELQNLTVGIIGFGPLGSAFAKKLRGFGCKIMAYDKYKTNYAPDYVIETSLEKLQAQADIISIHLPMSDETKYYIDSDFIDACAKPFFLVNTARGSHVKLSALLKGIESKKIRGACLDVLEFEKRSLQGLDFEELPPVFKKLTEKENVIFSPHVAGWTEESYVKLSRFLGEKIVAEFGQGF
jgi:D-3-phosphoglycerate dehydrogenase